jgi:transglutaminase-like putative cysteine protease
LRTFNYLLRTKIFITTVFLLLLSCFTYAEKYDDIYIEAAPKWVEFRNIKLTQDIPVDEITDGVFYQLLDTQKKVSATEGIVGYSRYVETVVNQAGVDYTSQINLDFDPSYQKLALNTLFIVRNGKRIDKLPSAKISLLNRETELENQIYNGSLTLNILIDDIQLGDTIDYSFTRYGNNPVYKGIFAYSRSLNWSVPVRDQFVRVLWGKKQPLFYSTRNISATVKEQKVGEFTEYKVHMNNAETLSMPSETPGWYEPYGSISFSENENWGDVIVWAETLYQQTEQHKSIVGLADEIKQNNESQAEQIAAALKYTQDNIRYVGLEMGVNSHLPTPAHETLVLKYGDCKDKALLFISILKALGIDAYPALVNTEETKLLDQRLPAVNLFDHVIVTLQFNGERIWLDPTLSYQTGRLEQLFQPDYGYALVIKEGEKSLTSMKNSQPNSYTHVAENYILSGNVEQAVAYNVVSEYLGDKAQTKHGQIERDGKKKLSQDYEVFYQRIYPKLTSTAPVEISTDTTSGVLKLTENYTINEFWTKKEVDYKRNFYATDIRDAVYKPKQLTRDAPLWFNYPDNIINSITIEFNEKNWEFDNESFVEDNDFFYFKRNVVFDDSTLRLTYEYRSKTDHIPVEQIDNYLAARKTLREKAYYGIIKYADKEENTVESSNESTMAIWLTIAIWAYIIGLIFVIVSWRIESSKRPEFSDSHFFPVAIVKFLVLSLFTMGFYGVYWMYRNWKAIKQTQQSDIMPIARAIFSIFWFYPLFSALKNDSVKRFDQNKVMLPFIAGIFAIAYFIFSSAGGYSEYAVLSFLSLLSPLLFIPLVKYINDVNHPHGEAYRYNSTWNVRSVVAIVLYLPLIGFTIAQETPFLPSDRVISQTDIMQHDMKYLYRQNVVPADETIHYFYSDAFFSIRDDGNGFTDKRVFSYWQDDDDGFQLENVAFNDIKDISVKYAEDKDDNTIITVTRLDDTNFKLFVSSIKAGDKLFVDKLKALWQSVKVS